MGWTVRLGTLLTLALVGGLRGAPAAHGGVTAGVPSASPAVNAPAFAGLGKLAFVQNGVLYALDGASGALTTLSAAGETAEFPRWSFDGAWVAYVDRASSPGTLHIVRADGSDNHSFADPASPSTPAFRWSPAQDTLAVSGGGLWLAPADGSPSLLVASAIDGADWSPDGATIAYTTVGRDDPSGISGLWTVAATGGTPELQYQEPANVDAGINSYGWAGSAPYLLFATDPYYSASLFADGVWLFSLAPGSGDPTPLAKGLLYDDWRSASPSSNTFIFGIPAGGTIALVEGTGREVYTNKSVAVCDLREYVGGCTPLPKPDGTVTIDPAWSPEGERLAYVQAPDLGHAGGFSGPDSRNAWLNAHALVAAQADGSQPRQITPAGEAADAPQWSRDGGTILYLCGVARAVCLVPSDGSATPVQIVDGLSGPPTSINNPLGYYGHFDPALVLAWWQPGL